LNIIVISFFYNLIIFGFFKGIQMPKNSYSSSQRILEKVCFSIT
jgi:hypothetical protein